jgi:hypothetical protein
MMESRTNVDNITGVHIKNNEGVDSLSKELGDVCTNQSDQVVQIFSFFSQFIFESMFITFSNSLEHIFNSESPPDLGAE